VRDITAKNTAWEQQLEIWTTPWGFLRGAAANQATLRSQTIGGRRFSVVSWQTPQKAPSGLPYKHHQTGEDNADAHLKRTIMGHQVLLPITGGTLDLGPWEQVFYAEFDGRRKKRVVVKVMGA